MPTPKETAHAAMLAAWKAREECVLVCRQNNRRDLAAIQAFAQKDADYRAAVAAFKAFE